ncbi:MAG: hypothetical protein Q4G60_00925 [bacterium]|nr:hypothetical protein [bacterium]
MEFVRVVGDDGRVYFGGNQDWFQSHTRARGGCGPVSGSNVLLMMAWKREDVRAKLGVRISGDGVISQDDYVVFMNDVYDTMGTWEIPVLRWIYDRCRRDNQFFRRVSPNNGRSIYGYVKGVLRFGAQHGLYLKAHALSTVFCDYDTGLSFIRKGLDMCGAVGLLTSYNRHELTLFHGEYNCQDAPYQAPDGMQNHFVTVTGIDLSNGLIRLVVSTWGRIAMIDYAELAASWQYRKALDSALIYFTPATSAETAESIKEAARILRTAVCCSIWKSSDSAKKS